MDFSIPANGDSLIILYLSDPREVRASNTKIIQKAEEAGYNIIVLTTNFPATVLEKIYNKNGIDHDNIYFIDSITRYSIGGNPGKDEHHVYTASPSDLTGLSIALSECINQVKGDKTFILLDSISTMLIYLPSDKISKFVHQTVSRLRQTEDSGAILAVDGGLDPMLFAQMSSFVDEVVGPE
ncbi:hypothetical protein F1737_09350 [Methanoplanus sp. FWC-SCC4]|uniref:KaiC-like domain-containing protein n=1 Tax=Methanochimaera problematica TaxID=2609417 RepID=A0AA97FEM2_9EURY|nr:hypothetical protein [Methanoplanus sp. FWC-SCC4]WOF16878.1 hypothetical protein F1737_09350 [Methanoplanus sp. FWC-SCC4]